MSKPILPNSSRVSFSEGQKKGLVGVEVTLTPNSVDACPEFVGIIEEVYFSWASNKWVADCKVLTQWYPPHSNNEKTVYIRYPQRMVSLYLKDLRGFVFQKVLNV